MTMSPVIGCTASLIVAGLILVAISWSLDTSLPPDLPESTQAIVLDAVCRANWHIVIDTLYNDVPVRVFEPAYLDGKANRPVMIFFHGGWASLEPDLYDPIAKHLAKSVPMVVISVRALEDCEKVTRYVIQQGHSHDLDPNKVVVAGEGAGGQLAAAVSLKVKKFIKMQVLISPWLQLFDLQTPSHIENRGYLTGLHNEGSVLDSWMRYGNISERHRGAIEYNRHTSPALKKSKYATYTSPTQYMAKHIRRPELRQAEKPNDFGDEILSVVLSKTITDPLFAPLMADDKDMAEGPSTAYVVTAGYDVAREDGMIYRKRLKNAGITVSHMHYENGFHGMLAFAAVDSNPGIFSTTFQVGWQAVNDLVTFLEENL